VKDNKFVATLLRHNNKQSRNSGGENKRYRKLHKTNQMPITNARSYKGNTVKEE
jgi:hypothetical protein